MKVRTLHYLKFSETVADFPLLREVEIDHVSFGDANHTMTTADNLYREFCAHSLGNRAVANEWLSLVTAAWASAHLRIGGFPIDVIYIDMEN